MPHIQVQQAAVGGRPSRPGIGGLVDAYGSGTLMACCCDVDHVGVGGVHDNEPYRCFCRGWKPLADFSKRHPSVGGLENVGAGQREVERKPGVVHTPYVQGVIVAGVNRQAM